MSYTVNGEVVIFFGSSIRELELERLKLESFVNDLSRTFERKYGVKLVPYICENADPAMTHGRTQEEYNEVIRRSKMCFFVFFKRAGEYTLEELEVARTSFDKNDFPKIYFYFKELEEGEQPEDSLLALQKQLDENFGHYYNFFGDIDTVKLRLTLQIILQEMDFVALEVKEGKCYAGGEVIGQVEELPEFSNHAELQDLRRQLADKQKECEKLKKQFDAPACPSSVQDEYIEATKERTRLHNEIEELESAIFDVTRSMCKDMGENCSERRIVAYRHFVAGELEVALKLLDKNTLDSESAALLRRAERNKKTAAILIGDYKQRVEILLACAGRSTRFDEATESYKTIESLIDEFGVCQDDLLDYANYCYKQNAYDEAKRLYLKLNRIYEVTPETTLDMKAAVYDNLGAVCRDLGDYTAAKELHGKALEIREKLYADNPSAHASYLAMSYNNLGVVCGNLGDYIAEKQWYGKALEIREKLYADNPSAHASDLAMSYNNLGAVCINLRDYTAAKEWLGKALEIREKLYADNPSAHASDLAISYNNLGVVCGNLGDYTASKEWYGKALEIREKLYADNPSAYASALARSYNNLGNVCRNLRDYTAAKEWHGKALEIREKLYADYPSAYASDLAISYNNLGVVCSNLGDYTASKEWYGKALEIREKLYADNPSAYASDLAISYNNLGAVCSNLGDYTAASEWYGKALAIREKLYEGNPSAHASDLAMVHNNMALILHKTGDRTGVKKHMKLAKALKKKHRL